MILVAALGLFSMHPSSTIDGSEPSGPAMQWMVWAVCFLVDAACTFVELH